MILDYYLLPCSRCGNMTTDAQTGERESSNPDGWLVGHCAKKGYRILAFEACKEGEQ